MSDEHELTAEVEGVLKEMGPFEVRVREGGGPESLAASLAVSVGKMKHEVARLEREAKLTKEFMSEDGYARFVRLRQDRDKLSELERKLSASESSARRMRGLIAELTDPDPCRYDHHGYCQTHSLHERPCPHERAKTLSAPESKERQAIKELDAQARKDYERIFGEPAPEAKLAPAKTDVAEVMRMVVEKADAELMALTESQLSERWYYSWRADQSIAWNIYEFSDQLEMFKRACRKWEGRNGTCCIVERVRDKYLMPKIKEFSAELSRAYRSAPAPEAVCECRGGPLRFDPLEEPSYSQTESWGRRGFDNRCQRCLKPIGCSGKARGEG